MLCKENAFFVLKDFSLTLKNINVFKSLQHLQQLLQQQQFLFHQHILVDLPMMVQDLLVLSGNIMKLLITIVVFLTLKMVVVKLNSLSV